MKAELDKFFSGGHASKGDVVGLDVATSGVKIVRLRRDAVGRVAVLAADIQPALSRPANDSEATPLVLAKPLRAPSAAICYSSRESQAKFLIVPGAREKVDDMSFAEILGLDKNRVYRCAHRMLDGEARAANSQILAAAILEADVLWLQRLLPHDWPALHSVEVAGLAALGCSLAGTAEADETRCELVIDMGAEVSTLGVFYGRRPVMVRQFAVGARALLAQVVRDLGVDMETARSVLELGSINAQTSLHTVLDGLLRQVSIAIDFAERRHGTRLQRARLCGGLAANADWCALLRAVIGMAPVPFDPWAGMDVAPAAAALRSANPGFCFAAATGAALAVMEDA